MTDPHTDDSDVAPAEPVAAAEPTPAQGAVSGETAALREALARAQADYSNLLKRTDAEKRAFGTAATRTVVLRLLPLVDNLERALATVPTDFAGNAWVEGIRGLHQKFLKDLESLGVTPFESVGTEIDSARHDVMAQGPGEAGTIVSEFEKGYLLHGEVMRHAKVIVGSGLDGL